MPLKIAIILRPPSPIFSFKGYCTSGIKALDHGSKTIVVRKSTPLHGKLRNVITNVNAYLKYSKVFRIQILEGQLLHRKKINEKFECLFIEG